MRKLIDANELIKDLKAWAESIKNVRDDDKVFFTEENILDLINMQKKLEQVNNLVDKYKTELEFTRKFIHEYGLEFALASAWDKYKANT